MNFLAETLIELVVLIVIFFALVMIGIAIKNKFKGSSNRYMNPHEFLPEDEVHTLRQLFYLLLMAACFINVFYSIIFADVDLVYFALFDIVLSLFIAVSLDNVFSRRKILLFLLVPYGALSYLLFGDNNILFIVDIIHVLVFLYFVKFYFDKFMEYTESNSLGVTIILLFSIIFISFFITQAVEGVNALDSLVMVSNAFTSNGYTVLGNSIAGKINSLFLVWGGYIISGAGTATLTAAILLRHFNKRVAELEKLIEEGDD